MRIQLAIGIWSSAFVASLGLGVGCGSTEAEPMGCDDTSNTELNGFVKCSGEVVHRPRIETCELKAPRGDLVCTSGSGDSDACHQDSDCNAEANGYCDSTFGFAPSCQCFYGCLQDSDCGDNQVCQCNGAAGECVAASCTSDADCPGSVCASYDVDYCGPETPGFACVTTRDECLSHDDCPGGGCRYANGKRSCTTDFCAGGRPFLVQSNIRTATLRTGSDWSAPGSGGEPRGSGERHNDELDDSIRAEIAAHYLSNGLMEHASIAAFARFSLQLMGLGAPRDLVRDSIAAQADELTHAELCFSVAARFGVPLDPAALDLQGALDEGSPMHVLTTTILEGCIGETVAAALAEEAALLCTDVQLAAMQRRIAEDEARHARLAWRAVGWLLQTYPQLKAEAARLFASAVSGANAEASSQQHSSSNPTLEAYGVLSPKRSAALHAAVLQRVIAPAARRMLATCPDAQPSHAAAS